MSASKLLSLFFFIAVLVTAAPAQAHKVISALYAGEGIIEGEIGFSNGDPAANAIVDVFNQTGTKIGETKTDEDGFFVYRPKKPGIHIFKANLGAGHVAEMRMDGAEMPGQPSSQVTTSAETSRITTNAAMGNDIQTLIAKAVRKEVKPLRKEIAAYKEKNDLQSILGGIGYIAGLFGVGFYIAARRKTEST